LDFANQNPKMPSKKVEIHSKLIGRTVLGENFHYVIMMNIDANQFSQLIDFVNFDRFSKENDK